jgi:hypothetical protein
MKYWIDTECEGSWRLYKDEEDGSCEMVSEGCWPEDAMEGDYTPAREEAIWEEVNSQIEKDLGFIPYYDIN